MLSPCRQEGGFFSLVHHTGDFNTVVKFRRRVANMNGTSAYQRAELWLNWVRVRKLHDPELPNTAELTRLNHTFFSMGCFQQWHRKREQFRTTAT